MLRIHKARDGVHSFTDDTACYGALAQHYAGLRAIPLNAIIGSVGRSQDLRPDFTLRTWPRGGDTRYHSICQAMQQGLALPAIDVYQVGDAYYVLDGHHRVAAARASGQQSIDAMVTKVQPMLTGIAQAA